MSEPDPYAPRANVDLRGHAAAERAFLEAWTSGRMPHAWLIGGPAGIGKATFAYRCARFVLKEGAEQGDRGGGLFGDPLPPQSLALAPDDPVAIRVASSGHGNLLTVERSFDEKRGRVRRDIIVDHVRRVVPFLRQTANEGGWRIVVIDGADSMNPSSQNAILKLLEEPPAKSLLLLTADNPGSLLPTIRSRCRKLALEPLPPSTVRSLVAQRLPALSDGEAETLVRLAEGSIGRALDLAASGGVALYGELVGLIAAMPRLGPTRTHAFAEGLTRGKGADTAYEVATELLVWWLGRLVRQIAAAAPEPEIIEGEGALLARLMRQPRALDRWLEVWEKVARQFVRADNANLDRKQVVLTALDTIQAAIP